MTAQMMDPDFLEEAKRFVQLSGKKADLKFKLGVVEKELEEMQEGLSNRFAEGGVSKITVDGATLYVKKDTFASLKVPDGSTPDKVRLDVVHLLESMGHERMITYNHQSMKALVKELQDEDGELPPPLGTYVKADSRYRVAARGVPPPATGTDSTVADEAADGGREE